MKFESYIGFDVAKTGEWIHSWESVMDCINDERVVDIAWLDNMFEKGTKEHDEADEIINVLYADYPDEDDLIEEGQFNIIIPHDVFKEKELREWMKCNPTKVWKGNKPGDEIRGVNY